MSEQNDASATFAPPPGPPPFLNYEQQEHLCRQGWLCIDLPLELRNLLQTLSREADTFFDQDDTTKPAIYPSSYGTELGFYRVVNEKEYVTLRRETHPETALEKLASQAWHTIFHLLYRVLCDLGRSRGLDSSVWSTVVKDSLSFPDASADLDTMTSLLRLFKYYPEGGTAEPHVDLGLLTLCLGDKPGLQVWDYGYPPESRGSGENHWEDAGNRACILVGDCLRMLLLNTARSGRHRVIANVEGRSSTVFALRPCLKGSIDLADFGAGISEVVTTKELYHAVKGSKHNINAAREIREKQREEHRQKMVEVKQRAQMTNEDAMAQK